MIKILWLLKVKIYLDFENIISNELVMKIKVASSFEDGIVYDIIIFEDISIMSRLSTIQKEAILVYVLNNSCNILNAPFSHYMIVLGERSIFALFLLRKFCL